MKSILHIMILCFLHNAASAQTGSIKGLVKDQENGGPLAGVSVQLQNDLMADISDDFGSFTLNYLTAGQYNMTISYIGYLTETIQVDIEEKKVTEFTIALRRSRVNLKDVIVSGKNQQSATTISAIDIRLRPVNSAQDLLRMTPGLFIAQHAGGGKSEQMFLRGYDLDHGTDINITVDGMPVNMVSHAHGQGYADLHFVIPELVEKINFDKGPYQAAHGNFATTGFVAFKTPDILHEEFVKAEYGSFNSTRITAAKSLYSRQKGDNTQQWYAGAEFLGTSGYFESPQDLRRLNIFSKFSSLSGKRTNFSVSSSIFSSRWSASGQIPQRAIDDGTIGRFGAIDDTEGGKTARFNLNAILKKNLGEKWALSQQAFYSKYLFDLYSNFTFFLENPMDGDQIQQKENRNIAGYNGTLSFKGASTGNRSFLSEIGYGIRHDDIADNQLNNSVRRRFTEHIQRGDIRETNLFGYWNNTFDFSRQWSLNAALRYDWFSFAYKDKLNGQSQFETQTRGVVSPKLNVTYKASTKFKLSLSTGMGFHSNDTRVILEQTAQEIIPRVYSLDIGSLWKPTKSLLIKTAIWYMYAEQEFVYVGDAGIVEPGGASQRKGFDLSVRYQLNQWLYSDVDFNYSHARSIEGNKGSNYIPLAPSLTSIGGITAQLYKGFSGSLRYRHLANRPANEDYSLTATGYWLTDAVLRYRWKKTEVFATVENLLNKAWNEAQFETESRLRNELSPISEMHFTPGAPRFIKAGIQVSL